MSETPHAHHKPREHLSLRQRPPHWPEFRAAIRSRWAVPFLYFDWLSQWAVYVMSRMSLFDLLEYCGSLSILIAVIFYFLDAPQRTKMRHYQAWQVINSAQGKGGSGGRIEALGAQTFTEKSQNPGLHHEPKHTDEKVSQPNQTCLGYHESTRIHASRKGLP